MRTPSGESSPPDATQNAMQSSVGAVLPDDDTSKVMTPLADAPITDAAPTVGATPADSPSVAADDAVNATGEQADPLADPTDPTDQSERQQPPRRRSSRPARSSADEAERVARSGTFILTMTLVSALLVSGLLLTLSSVTRLNAGPTQPETQRQVTPTPTTAAFPTPTAEPGFQLYIDRSDGFLMQYPTGWALVSLTPGIDFKDDPNSPAYIVQVLFPGSFSAPTGQGGNQNDGAFWVNYALNGLSTTLTQQGMGALVRQANCPAPYMAPTTIGGATWQCGAGYDVVGVTPTPTTTPGASPTATPRATPSAGPTQTPGSTAPASGCSTGSCLQVVVLATVYHGKPYIISLLSSSDRFEAGDIEFFQPMLNSFAFLPQA